MKKYGIRTTKRFELSTENGNGVGKKSVPAATAVLLACDHERVAVLEAAAQRSIRFVELQRLRSCADASRHAQQPNASTTTAAAVTVVIACATT